MREGGGGLCLRLSLLGAWAICPPQCCITTQLKGCHLLSTFSIRSLDPGAPSRHMHYVNRPLRPTDHAELPINTNRECSTPGRGGVADSVQMVFKLAASIPAEIDDSQPRHPLPINRHLLLPTFPSPLVLTISETYDHIPQLWCALNVRRLSSKRNLQHRP
jgi:hypothetical protein